MIKLFRTIRQNLLNEGKTSKYLKYAIGEIVLVVIGILIALQINNWNETRKEKVKEKHILIELERDLEANTKTIQSTIDNQSRVRNEIDIVMNHLKNKKPFNDSIGRYITDASLIERIQFRSSAYESLKTMGMDIISSDSIRANIADLFGNEFPYRTAWLRDAGVNNANFGYIYYIKFFELSKSGIRVPTDYENLLKNQEFINVLANRRGLKSAIIYQLALLLENVEKVRASVNKELETFD